MESLIASLQPIFARYPALAAVYLFGSVARQEAGPGSDLDLGLLFCRRGEEPGRHRLLGDLASRLEAVAAPAPVDLVVLEEQGPVFCHRVLLTGHLVYEADRERRIDFESETIVRALDFAPTYALATRGRVAGLRRWLERQGGA